MRIAGAVIASCACAVLAVASAADAWAQGDGRFEQLPFPELSWTLDDLGVTDYDDDGDIDVFTTNHLSTQLLMSNDGSGAFEDRLTAEYLNQTPAIPGWEDDPNVPEDVSEEGLYIFRRSGIALQTIGASESVSGQMRFLAPVTVKGSTGAAQLRVDPDTSEEPPRNVANFVMHGRSTLDMKPESSGLPVEVSIDPSYPLDKVFIGRRGVHPPASTFTLYQRDRHGMAWADFNRDGRSDVFITRGGVSGNIKTYRGAVQDELQLATDSGFRESIGGSGIGKGECRGRAAVAVDYNRDGLLDIFNDCFGSSPRLFRQLGSGAFKSVSGKLARANVKGTPFEWIDLGGDGKDELVAARKRRFVVYRLKGRKWERVQSLRGRHEANAQKLTIADYDSDGDPDIFAASKSGSSLLVNRRGKLHKVRPASIGLPSRALTANWVDYDNDGLTDLHLIPGGLYQQLPNRRFARSGLAQPGPGPVKAVASWFDIDSDGARDAVLGVRHQGEGRYTELSLLRNDGPIGHWLEVDLRGLPGNREAIGAKVSATAAGRTQTQWVGQSDGAHLSLGHYRLYFGLGGATAAALRVTWPDGAVQEVGSVGADRIVRVTRASARRR